MFTGVIPTNSKKKKLHCSLFSNSLYVLVVGAGALHCEATENPLSGLDFFREAVGGNVYWTKRLLDERLHIYQLIFSTFVKTIKKLSTALVGKEIVWDLSYKCAIYLKAATWN